MKKIVILFIIPVIALSLIGSSYALWSKTISLSGEITTGYLNLNWEEIKSNDPPTSKDPGYDIDVADCNPKIVHAQNYHATLSIDNAYPSYRCRVDFKIKNGGTIPTTIDDVILTYDSTAMEIYIDPNIIGNIMDRGDIVAGSINIHFLQQAVQYHTYEITIQIIDTQWNGKKK